MHLPVDVKRQVHRILNEGNLRGRFDATQVADQPPAIGKPRRAHLRGQCMIEEKRQTIVKGKSAALGNKAGDESGAALLLFPDQDFPGRCGSVSTRLCSNPGTM